MASIVTITFSPCIDKSTTVPRLIPERKLKCTDAQLDPGGGGINVARVLHSLGLQATAVFPSGGYTGKYFNHLLEKEGIDSIIIETQNETRENFIILEEATTQQFRFGMPGTELKEKEWKECLKVVAGMEGIDFLVASGSLPPGVPDDVYAQLGRIAKSKNAKFILDSSGEPLKLAIEEGVFLIKPNLREFISMYGMEDLSIDQISAAASELVMNGKCNAVVISLGAGGALLVQKDRAIQFHAPDVDMKSSVGAGDSMVAGIIYSLVQGSDFPTAVKYGIACGSAATMNPGTALCRKEDADRLFKKMNR
jgi:6-phosphofructokinase 2